jgi:PAS domain S-box-containing protein
MEDDLRRVIDALAGDLPASEVFRLIAESIAAPVAVLHADWGVETLNRAALEYFGMTLAQLKNWAMAGVVHPHDLPAVMEAVTRSATLSEPYDIEHRCRRGDGAWRWFHVRGVPLRNREGGILRWYVLLTDIHDRKLAEDALNGARADLAHVSRIATLGTLTASIAHEVNNPLSGIVTNAEACLRMLAADPPDIEGARDTARRTIRDGRRAAEVVSRLRALFANNGSVTEPVDLNEATREVIALSRSELQRGGVILRLELGEGLPPVAGDRVQLQQVVLNLLLNAAEAMNDVGDRPRQLVVRTEPDGGERVRLTVEDAGVGLGPQDTDKLFQSFYTTKKSGMGIGLWVSRSIVERHGGRLWATPRSDGPGACFSFSIPITRADPVQLTSDRLR